MDSLSQQFARSLAEHTGAGQSAWLAELRGRAAELFGTNGLPGPGVERWKYTSLRTLERRAPQLGFGGAGPDAATVPAPLIEAVPRVALVNGSWSLLDGALPAGVTALPLEQVLESGNEAVRRQLEALEIGNRSQGFSALNTAALGPGVFIHVTADTDAGTLLLQWLSVAAEADELFNSRVCVLLEAGAKLELLEQFENGLERAPVLNLVMQCQLESGAELHHTRVQQESPKAVLVTRSDVRQAGGSRYRYAGLDLGGGLVRHDIHGQLQESGAECRLHSACLAWGRAHMDIHMDIDHAGPECESRQLFRGVLGDRSRVVFNGRVYVAEGADGTEARQSSAGLLLSPHAEIDAKPELEIHADEVVASHGATVGQLDEDALFYLRSRGLDMAAARNLLTMAFCRSVVDQLPSETLREVLGARLKAGLQAGGVN